MTEPILVTPTQNEYLEHLATGPKTTRDFALELMVSGTSAAKILKKLRDAGLIRSTKLPGAQGNIRIHELTDLYHNTKIIISTNRTGMGVSDEEIYYAAILRNAGLTGQQLTTQYNKIFPDRPPKGVLSTVLTKARKRKLCR